MFIITLNLSYEVRSTLCMDRLGILSNSVDLPINTHKNKIISYTKVDTKQ